MTWNCFSGVGGVGENQTQFPVLGVGLDGAAVCWGVFFCVLFCFSSLFWFCFGFF